MLKDEINRVKNMNAHVIKGRDEVFKDWKTFLDRPFYNMPPGFTSYHVFEFVQVR